MKRVLVLGGGGFIGGHLVKRLVQNGDWVRSVDIKPHQYGANPHEFILGDLTDSNFCQNVFSINSSTQFDEIYQLAADMGGAGYIFTGDNDADVMSNSSIINLNVLKALKIRKVKEGTNRSKIFYSSSACIYPEEKQKEIENPGLNESDAYPANPDSEYGWEKLFSERLYLSFARNYEIPVRIARFHNIYGPEGTWRGGKEKAPAAICRKVAEADSRGTIQIWGDGLQTRSFLFIEDCLDAIELLMKSDFDQPVNIGSEEMVNINKMIEIVSSFEGKELLVSHIEGPQGVRGRNSDNRLMHKVLNHKYKYDLENGLRETYFWILNELALSRN